MNGFVDKVLMADKVKKRITKAEKDEKTEEEKNVLVEEKEPDLPDYRGDERKWPDYWKKEALTGVEPTVLQPAVIEPTPGT
jgi:hypothetical protein